MTVIDQVQTGPRIPGLEACRDGLRPLGRGFDEIGALLQRAGVSRLACLTGLDSPSVPVWSCIRPRSKSLATSFGKGLTEPQAQISAVMEALESAHAEDCVARVCRTASLDAILVSVIIAGRRGGERVVEADNRYVDQIDGRIVTVQHEADNIAAYEVVFDDLQIAIGEY